MMKLRQLEERQSKKNILISHPPWCTNFWNIRSIYIQCVQHICTTMLRFFKFFYYDLCVFFNFSLSAGQHGKKFRTHCTGCIIVS
jgi:hypothetical protein